MRVMRYEDSLSCLVDEDRPIVFLAGPTVRGNQPHLTSWREEAIGIFERIGFIGVLVVPEFTSRTESDKGKMWIPPWEFAGLCIADTILFWVPRTRELIGLTTNHEHGYWLAERQFKTVYGRPDDAYRTGYLDLMWAMAAKQHGHAAPRIWSSLLDTVVAADSQAKCSLRVHRTTSHVAVESPYGAFSMG